MRRVQRALKDVLTYGSVWVIFNLFLSISQLVIPSYRDSTTLRNKFMLALHEGGEGFLLK